MPPQHPSALHSPIGRARRRQGVWLVLLAAAAAVALAALTATGDARAGTRADTPTRGGELKLLGTSDVFNIDTVSAYYTVSNLLERAWTRQLVSYVNAPTFPGSIKLAADVAAALPVNGNGISADGKTYTFKIRQGVQWDTSPPRQVTADDFVREFKLLCNPISPVGAPGYFTSTIVGMKAYCDGFAKVKKPTVDGIAAYVSGHKLAGVVATDPSTLTFKLLQPAGDFLNILTMGFASARPVEYDKYLPDSAELRQHTIADGPYKITSYTATKGFTLARNPAWTQASDPLRHAYVDKITITEGLSSTSVQQQIEAGTGDMEWDIQPPSQDLPRLISAGDKGLILGPTGPYYVAIGYYLALNQYAGVMKKKLVRQAVATAVNKNSIVQILGGPKVNAISNQIIPPGNVGFVPGFNAYPANTGGGNAAASKALLAKAGYPNGLAIKILSSTSDPGPRVAQAHPVEPERGRLQGDARPRHADRLLRQVPDAAERGQEGRVGHRAARLHPRLVRQQRPLHRAAALHQPRPGLDRLGRIRQSHGERARRQGADRAHPRPGQQALGRGADVRHEGRGLRADQRPEVADLPLRQAPGLQLLLVHAQLRRHQRVDQVT